jgi:hypothetical protein
LDAVVVFNIFIVVVVVLINLWLSFKVIKIPE